MRRSVTLTSTRSLPLASGSGDVPQLAGVLDGRWKRISYYRDADAAGAVLWFLGRTASSGSRLSQDVTSLSPPSPCSRLPMALSARIRGSARCRWSQRGGQQRGGELRHDQRRGATISNGFKITKRPPRLRHRWRSTANARSKSVRLHPGKAGAAVLEKQICQYRAGLSRSSRSRRHCSRRRDLVRGDVSDQPRSDSRQSRRLGFRVLGIAKAMGSIDSGLRLRGQSGLSAARQRRGAG